MAEINTAAADLIASALTNGGLPHPGNADTNQPPTLIRLPGLKPGAGLPPEYARAMKATAQSIGEAIVNLLATGGYTLVPTDTLTVHEDVMGTEYTIIRCTDCNTMLFGLPADGKVNPRTFTKHMARIGTDCTTGHRQ